MNMGNNGHICNQEQVSPDSLVALFLDKNELMIVAILGVWKSGAAYVPIDPNYPDQRVQFILNDTKTSIIISNKHHKEQIDRIMQTSNLSLLNIEIDRLELNNDTKTKTANNSINAGPTNLAYVIYTSGSTSLPKGVLIEHRTVISFYNSISSFYFKTAENSSPENEQQQEAILFLSNYTFDASVMQLIISMLNGNKLVILPTSMTFDDSDSYGYLNDHGLSIIIGTPSQLQHIDLGRLNHLNNLSVGGEPLYKHNLDYFRENFDGLIMNMYGPTEATMINTVEMFASDDKFVNSLGKPLANTFMYILDEHMRVVPPGAIGELYITGNCLARGYLNLPEENLKSFIINPIQTIEEKRDRKNCTIYKTGDLVKINGIRIELGEIENTLSSFSDIKQCSVVVVNDNNIEIERSKKHLVAYYVSTNNEEIIKDLLVDYLTEKLPMHMVPKLIIHIRDVLPLTSHGKLDQKALPKPNFALQMNDYIAPRSLLEEKLCFIWEDMLGVPTVGINDDFFMLGGDSIILMQLTTRMRNELNLNISVKDIFNHCSIKKLSALLLEQNGEGLVKEQFNGQHRKRNFNGDNVTSSGLLPIQKYYFAQDFEIFSAWKQTFTIKAPCSLNLEKLKTALGKLFTRHGAFRLRFKLFRLRFKLDENNDYMQYYADSDVLNDFDVKILTDSQEELKETLQESLNQFNVQTGSLFCVCYQDGFSDGTSRLVFSMHHLIVDSVSWRIICRDLERLYKGLALNKWQSATYLQWVNAVEKYYSNNCAETERQYWQEVAHRTKEFNRKIADLFSNLEAVKPITVVFSLSTEHTEHLLRNCPQVYEVKRIDTLLLTALSRALNILTNLQVNYVTLEGHGREADFDEELDVSDTVGWFTTMFPIELISTADNDLEQDARNVKKVVEDDLPNNGLGYGPLVGYHKNVPRICFNYLGQFNKNITQKLDAWALVEVGEEYDGGSDEDTANTSPSSDADIMSVLAFIANGRMHFKISSRLGTQKCDQFVDCFKATLEEIIQHANSKNLPVEYINGSIEDIELPANSMHQSFIYNHMKANDDTYIVHYLCQYSRKLNPLNMKTAWLTAQKKFPSLRLRFLVNDNEILQIITHDQSLDWHFLDISDEIDQPKSEEVMQIMDRAKKYILEEGRLFRIYLVKRREDLFDLLFSCHHIILDGWSTAVLFEFVHEIYLKLENSESISILQDNAYIKMQYYLNQSCPEDLHFWKEQLVEIEK
uniref:Fatty acid synthase n=1 Tax=Acrobeloides nanus TaxID=290746 RepID=A0A914CJE5_9BILA